MMSVISSGTGQAYKLEDVLDIVRNEDLYKGRLKEINDFISTANEASAKLTKAKDLDSSLQSAKKSEQQAKSALEEAQVKAAQLLTDAATKGKEIVTHANESINDILIELNSKKEELSLLNTQANLIAQQIEVLSDKYNELVNEVTAKQEEKKALHL